MRVGRRKKRKITTSSAPLLLVTVFCLLNSVSMLPPSPSLVPYVHANCSSEPANCMPLLVPRPPCTLLSPRAHNFYPAFQGKRTKIFLFSHHFRCCCFFYVNASALPRFHCTLLWVVLMLSNFQI